MALHQPSRPADALLRARKGHGQGNVRQVFLRRRHGLPEARESEPDGGHMEDHQDHKEHRKGGKGTWHRTGRPGKPSGHPKMKVTV